MTVRYGIPINISVGMNSTERTIIASMYVEIYWPKQNKIFDKYTSINEVYFQINMYKNEKKVQLTVIHVQGNHVHLKEHLTCNINFTS